MKSDVHKVLHPIAGRAMLDHLLGVLDGLGPARKVVVVGSGREQVEHLVEARKGEVEIGRHTSELQSLMRNSYAVLCLQTKTWKNTRPRRHITNDTKLQHTHAT